MNKLFFILCLGFATNAFALTGIHSALRSEDVQNFSAPRTPQSCQNFSGHYRGQCRSGNTVTQEAVEIDQNGCSEINLDAQAYSIDNAVFSQTEDNTILKNHFGAFVWDRNANSLSYGIFMTAFNPAAHKLDMQFNDGGLQLSGNTLFINGTSTMRWGENGNFRRAMVPFSCTLYK